LLRSPLVERLASPSEHALSKQARSTEMTALEIQNELHRLRAERAVASIETGAAYLADLDEEIEATRVAYVATAVTEIATLRAELFGAQLG
jgi:hypothetical protein